MPKDAPPAENRILLPYNCYDLERRELVTAYREFDPAHAAGQIWGVIQTVCDILNQLHFAKVVELGDGIERIRISSPISMDEEARFGPAYDQGKVSAFVATIAAQAVKSLFDQAAERNGHDATSVGLGTSRHSVDHFIVEAPSVRKRLAEAAAREHPAEASVLTWYAEAIEKFHGDEWWPRADFIRWYIAQSRQEGR